MPWGEFGHAIGGKKRRKKKKKRGKKLRGGGEHPFKAWGGQTTLNKKNGAIK